MTYEAKMIAEYAAKLDAMLTAKTAEVADTLKIGSLNSAFEALTAPTLSVRRLTSNCGGNLRSVQVFSGFSTVVFAVPPTSDGLAKFKADFAALIAADKLIDEKNSKINAENKQVVANLTRICLAAGLPERVYVDTRKTRGSVRKMEWVPAPWIANLDAAIPSKPVFVDGREVLRQVEEIVANEIARRDKAKADAIAARLANPILPLAVAFLAERGLSVGKDFELAFAIDKANDVLFAELVKASHDPDGDWELSGDFRNGTLVPWSM